MQTHHGSRQWACSTVRGPLNKTMNDAVHEEFVELHVVSKYVQSIRTDRRLEDMLLEVALCQFDLLCLSECWRADGEECMYRICSRRPCIFKWRLHVPWCWCCCCFCPVSQKDRTCEFSCLWSPGLCAQILRWRIEM